MATGMKLKRVSANLLILVLLLSSLFFSWDVGIDLRESVSLSFLGFVHSKESRLDKAPAEVQALLDTIRRTTLLASGGTGSTLTNQQAQEWRRQNPCKSRSELLPMYDARRHVKKLPGNPLWDEVLQEYSKLHRICMQKVGNLTNYFVSKNITIPGCKFLVTESKAGLGNKVLVTASAVLYAVVTQRVLLLSTGTELPFLFCEPFLGSSWMARVDKLPMPGNSMAGNDSWLGDPEFFKRLDHWVQGGKDGGVNSTDRPPLPLVHSLVVATGQRDRWQPTPRFFCKSEQEFMSHVPWIYYSGCIYTIPKIFSSPAFSSTLDALFPDKMVLTRLLRSILLPNDIVWNRLKQSNYAYFDQANRRVGIQLRFRNGISDFSKKNTLMNDRVQDCVLKNGILPKVGSWDEFRRNASSSAPVTKVYIACLFPNLQNRLNEFYLSEPTVTGEYVGVIQLTSHQTQSFSLREDQEAFVEVLLLSLSDELLVTPLSTFGGLAQAYGALIPWFVESREDKGLSSCQRGKTIDVCHQFTHKQFECPYDSEVDKRLISDVVPMVQDCLTVNHDQGLELITTFST